MELPQAAPAHPGRGPGHGLGRGAGRHLRRGVPARAAADDRDRLARAGRAADRRDRQDRPGVRGDAARAAVRLPDLDPRARPHRGAHAPGRAADLEQHARADRGAQAPLPVPVARLPLEPSTSSRSCGCTRPSCRRRSPQRLVEVVQMVRELDLKKPPSIAESIDWARALLLLGADDIDADVFRSTLSIIVKHRTDLDTVAERVGVRLGVGSRTLSRSRPASSRSRRSCAAEGLAVGTSELLDAFARARRGRAGPRSRRSARRSPPRSPSRPRTGASSTSCSSASSSAPPRRRRWSRACARGPRAPAAEDEDGITGGEQIDYDNLREQLIQAIRDGDESAMRDLARLAIVAFGRRGEGSGVLGVDVQRIRRALGLRSEPGGPVPRDGRRAAPAAADARPDPALRAAPAARARARADRAHAVAAALAAAERARPRAAVAARCRTSPPCTASSPSSSAGSPPRATRRAGAAATRTSTCAARCARRCRPAACRSSSSTARGGRSARSCTCCATSRPRSPARRCSS